MKKSLIIMLFISIILCMITTCVFADTVPVSLEGSTSATPGSTVTVNVKISSSDTIGVVSGVIGYNSNITSVEVSGKNNWVATYNSETGKFNAYKAEGGSTEEIIQIKYVTSNTEGTGTITLSDLQITNTNYETKNINDITKNITIKKESADNPADNPTDEPTDNTIDNSTDKTEDQSSDNKSTIKDSTTSKADTKTSVKTLPYAGKMKEIVLPIGIVLLGIISVVAYMGYKKYREIK